MSDATPAVGEQPVTELAPGVWLAPARWNALLIGQPAGALVVDAPISERYVGRTLDEVQRRFGKPAAAENVAELITQMIGAGR